MKIIKLIGNSFNKKIDAIGLAWFRVFYLFFLLQDILKLLNNSELIFDPIPFVWSSDISFDLILIIWSGVVVSMMLGIKTRFNSVLNYIFTIFIFSTLSQFEYHIYYIYCGVNFLLIFIPIERVFSIDNLILKLRNSKLNNEFIPSRTTTVWSYWLLLFVGIGLVYLGSVFFKLVDIIWLRGLGLWWPASFPVACNIPMQWLLDQEYLIKFLGYFALFFELVFIFIFWFKKLRLSVAVIGIIFHIGIYLFFPIPFFALAVGSIYLLCIPIKYWKFTSKFCYQKERIAVYYDAECPLCLRTKIVIEHFDFFKAVSFKTVQRNFSQDLASKQVSYEDCLNDLHGIDKNGNLYIGFDLYRQILLRSLVFLPIAILFYLPGFSHIGRLVYKFVAKNRETQRCNENSCVLNVESNHINIDANSVTFLKNFTFGDLKVYLIAIFLVFALFWQLVVIYFSPACSFVHPIVSKVPFVQQSLIFCQKKLVQPTVFLTGITDHNVFLKGHFAKYTDALKISYCDPLGNEQDLPIIDDSGRPVGIVSGCVWANWTFRAMGPNINSEHLLFGIKRYTANWLGQRNDGAEFRFKIYTKKMIVPTDWEKGVLSRELNRKEWQLLGEAVWVGREFSYKGGFIK
jgi:predicted DCC family thiol-disulfide oxidoreductase YuxK